METVPFWKRLFAAPTRETFAEETFTPYHERSLHAFDAALPGAEETLQIYLENPLARRIVALTTQYVIGRGVELHADDPEAQRFLQSFYDHPLNRLNYRIGDWCDELTRSGNLFLRLSSDASGMTFVRALPASLVRKINCAERDAENALSYELRSPNATEFSASETIPASDRANPTLGDAIFQVAINRPVGTVWGNSDLSPVLKWIRRYSAWLEDRARLNRYRNSFLFIVKSRLSSESQRLARQKALNAAPPTPGSILVTTENEEWGVIAPRLESQEAGEDGLALKKMIAVGAGIPLHFLAEQESENKASAEAAGSAAYRGLAMRQQFFHDALGELMSHILARAALVNRRIDPEARIRVTERGASSIGLPSDKCASQMTP